MKRLFGGLLALGKSFLYAFAGITFTARTQRNFRVQLVCTLWILHLGYIAALPPEQWALLWICCGLVLSLELVNTAIEALVDLCCGQRYHPLAKIAKDAAAGGVLASALCSVGVALVLLARQEKWRLLLGYVLGLSGREILLYAAAAGTSLWFIFALEGKKHPCPKPNR